MLEYGVLLDKASLGPSDLSLEPILRSLPQWAQFDSSGADDVPSRIANCQVIVTNKVPITAQHIQTNPQLKLICVAATGTNNVDLEAAKAQGVTVCNVVNYGPNSVAQHALMLMLNLATNAPQYAKAAADGRWSKSPFFCLLDYPIVELANKTLGIVGYGVLGQQVAKLGDALGMRVIVSARPGQKDVPKNRVMFEEVLTQADVLSLHCPLTADNSKLINRNTLALMKPTAFLINCARGGLIDELALADALRRGKLGGAGLDVLSTEPPPADHPLLASDIPNLIVTPHSAWASREARQNLVNIIGDNIEQFKAGKAQNRVC